MIYSSTTRWNAGCFASPDLLMASDSCSRAALLLVVWKTPITRPTRDVDLLGRVSNDLDAVRSLIAEIVLTPVEDDGLVFDAASVATERIRGRCGLRGCPRKFRGGLGNTRVTMQIDIGFSDVITPGPAWVSYPTILEQPSVQLLAYNRETAIAEKFEAMVKLGDLNTRMKDFFDVWLLAANFEFDGLSLVAAVRATFAQRQTPLEVAPAGFSDQFARNPTKEAQWMRIRPPLAPTACPGGVLRGRSACPRFPSADRTSHR